MTHNLFPDLTDVVLPGQPLVSKSMERDALQKNVFRVVIYDVNENEVFSYQHDKQYRYNATGCGLYNALLVEAAWAAHKPQFDLEPQRCGVRMPSPL